MSKPNEQDPILLDPRFKNALARDIPEEHWKIVTGEVQDVLSIKCPRDPLAYALSIVRRRGETLRSKSSSEIREELSYQRRCELGRKKDEEMHEKYRWRPGTHCVGCGIHMEIAGNICPPCAHKQRTTGRLKTQHMPPPPGRVKFEGKIDDELKAKPMPQTKIEIPKKEDLFGDEDEGWNF